jgi:hypothetical protein
MGVKRTYGIITPFDVWTYGARYLNGITRMEKIGDQAVASGAGVKGAYVQLVAATARAYYGILVKLRCGAFGNDLDFFVDIAVGAGGAEQVIASDIHLKYHMIAAPASTFENGAMIEIPVYIPVGTRVAARAQSPAVNNVTVTVEGAF